MTKWLSRLGRWLDRLYPPDPTWLPPSNGRHPGLLSSELAKSDALSVNRPTQSV